MKLYDLAGSPNTRRVRIFVAESAVLLAKAVCDVPTGENHTYLNGWWERVAARPTAPA